MFAWCFLSRKLLHIYIILCDILSEVIFEYDKDLNLYWFSKFQKQDKEKFDPISVSKEMSSLQQNIYKSSSCENENVQQIFKKIFQKYFFLLKQSFLNTFLSYFMKGSQFKSRAHRRGHHPERDTSDSLSGDQLIRAFQELKDVSFFFSFFFKESLLCYPHQPWPWKQTHEQNTAKNLWAGGYIQQAEEKRILYKRRMEIIHPSAEPKM